MISKSVPKEKQDSYTKALGEALAVGAEILQNGGGALDATEAGKISLVLVKFLFLLFFFRTFFHGGLG